MINNHLRILITTPSLNELDNVSGISSVVRNILVGFKAVSAKALIYPFFVGRKDSDKKSWLWILKQIAVPFFFAIQIVRLRANVIHVNGPLDTVASIRDMVLVLVSRLLFRHVVFHVHGGPFVHVLPDSLFFKCVICLLLKFANAIVVLGEIEASSLVKLYRVDGSKINVMPNSVEVPECLPVRKNANSLGLNILFMGRLVEEKGVKILIDALLRLKKSNINFSISFYGAGPLQSYIVESLSSFGDSFYFGGVAKSPERQEIFSNADILVLPSLYGEGLPMVILEAMASGVVVVATPDGSIPEVVKDRETGFLVSKGDSQAIFMTFLELINQKSTGQLTVIEKNAFNLAASRYDVVPYSKKLLELYSNVVS